MPRPLTRTQALENRAFLKVLQRTGNVRLSCREVGVKYGTMQDRRKKHPGFAVKWQAALVMAAASFDRLRTGGSSAQEDPSTSFAGSPPHAFGAGRNVTRVAPCASRPVCSPLRPARYRTKSAGVGRDTPLPSAGIPSNESVRRSLEARSARRAGARHPLPLTGEGLDGAAYRTRGGEMTIVRTRQGRLQMRRAQPGKLTREAEQAFLAALAATCNIALASAAVGAAEAAFHRRRRKDPAFAREMRMALAEGYEAIELAVLEGLSAYSHMHDDWRHNEPPAVPPMTVNQALQLMHLHQKQVVLQEELQRREYAAALRMERAVDLRSSATRDAPSPGSGPGSVAPQDERVVEGEGRIFLPDLAQVTGWSKADPAKAPHDATRALFGGWRLEEMENVLLRRQESRRAQRF